MFRYYPKSQIKPNLTTSGGEFDITSTGEEYAGDYYKTSTNDFYTGKNPNEGENIRITPRESTIEVYNLNLYNPLQPTNSQSPKDTYWTLDHLRSPLPSNPPPKSPLSFYPTPIEEDYNLKTFNRYFLSKLNEPKFIEIGLPQYDLYISKDSQVDFNLYKPLTVNWVISGVDRNEVHATNHQSVKDLEKSSNSPGFTSYFKGRFSLFYK